MSANKNTSPTPEEYLERRLSRRASKISIKLLTRSTPMKEMKAYEWLLEPQFYLVTCLYMAARIFINVSQSYISFYVQYSLFLSQDMIAIIPMIIFFSGFAVSMVLNFVVDKFGCKISYLGSCVVGIGNYTLVGYALYWYTDMKKSYLKFFHFFCSESCY